MRRRRRSCGAHGNDHRPGCVTAAAGDYWVFGGDGGDGGLIVASEHAEMEGNKNPVTSPRNYTIGVQLNWENKYTYL